MSKRNNDLSGIFLDADTQQLYEIDLPLVRHLEQIYDDGKMLSSITLNYGEFAFMGDFHYGHESFSSSVLHGYLNYLKQHPNIQIGIMGDILECGSLSHFITADESKTIDDEIDMFVADFKPLANRIKFIIWGNHEERIVRDSEMKNLLRTISFELGLNPDKDLFIGKPQRGLFAVFKSGNQIYGSQIHHSKTGAKINQDIQLSRSGSQNLVALIAHGHTHRLTWKPRTFRTLEVINGSVKNVVRRQYLLATGCFLKYPSYAEASSMPYTEVGCPIIRFFADEHNMQYYDLTGIYKEYLAKGGVFWNHAKSNVNIFNGLSENKVDSGVTNNVKSLRKKQGSEL